MIGRWASKTAIEEEDQGPLGFDDFELRLGDVLRGERATMGKSLLDVQRELKIKASYIAAIENADPSVFDTPGFIAGYVRSYARYLSLDPDWAFDTFCEEGKFVTAHGMSNEASAARPSREERLAALAGSRRDPFSSPATPFVPVGDALFSKIEPRAIGSTLVLLGLISGIGYGGWSVLQEVQRVQFTPIEQAPNVVATMDPLAGASLLEQTQLSAGMSPTRSDALDRLYRPQALDMPVMVPRDGPISTLDPQGQGSFAQPVTLAAATPEAAFSPVFGAPVVQVVEADTPAVVLFAVRGSWVRVRAADGSVIFEKVLDAGEEYILPVTEEPATLRAGNSGSLYFKVNGQVYGPAGVGTSTAKDVVLAADLLKENYQIADITADTALAEVLFAQAQMLEASKEPAE